MKYIDVPYLDQSGRWPTGCESVSAVMLLRYLGIEIGVDDFISRFLKRRDMERVSGVLRGPNPSEYFCGSPYDYDSFGCYAPVIADALSAAAGDDFLVVDESGTALETLFSDYIDRELPVIFWASIDMKEPVIGPSWELYGGGSFTWISQEHCLLLVGYDDGVCIFSDPWEGRGVVSYPIELVKKRHEAFFSMAIGMKRRRKQTEIIEQGRFDSL